VFYGATAVAAAIGAANHAVCPCPIALSTLLRTDSNYVFFAPSGDLTWSFCKVLVCEEADYNLIVLQHCNLLLAEGLPQKTQKQQNCHE